MPMTANRPVPRRKVWSRADKMELLLSLRETARNSRHPVPRWVSEEMRRLEREFE